MFEAVLVQARRRRALSRQHGIDPETVAALIARTAGTQSTPETVAVQKPASIDDIAAFFGK